MKKITLLLCSALLPVAAIAAENRIPNGSFEKGSENWSYEEWKGLPLPGRIEKGTAPDGQSYFVMTEPGTMTMRFIRTAHVPVERGRNYLLHFSLAGEGIRKGSITVKILQYGPTVDRKTPVLGWIEPKRKGYSDLLPEPLEGTFPWKKFEVEIPGSAIHPEAVSVAVYFHHNTPSFGELSIDAVELVEEKQEN